MYRIKTYHPPGTAPGTLTAGEPGTGAGLSIRLIDYTKDDFTEQALASAEACSPFLTRDSRTWIQVDGRPDPATLRELGAQFGLHELALEDVLNLGQRPKLDIDDEQLFMILSLPSYDGEEFELTQISIFAGENYIICFCPLAEDPFEPIRKRLRGPNNQRIRVRGADYLLYALVDLVVDAAFPLLEGLSESIEVLEDELLEKPDADTLAQIHNLRRDLLMLRRALWPQREVIGTLLRGGGDFVDESTQPYLRDCYDHSIQIMDLLESFREMSSSLLDVYLSSISQRTNEIMRLLTIIATIFIPLTFVVGVYGMNFEHPASPWAMPELGWYYGYPLIWAVMLSVVGGMLWYFRRRSWL
jgi:magnesium transporter